jgi:hypothetical protein
MYALYIYIYICDGGASARPQQLLQIVNQPARQQALNQSLDHSFTQSDLNHVQATNPPNNYSTKLSSKQSINQSNRTFGKQSINQSTNE